MSGFLSVSRCPLVKVRVWRSAAGLRGRRWVGSIRSILNRFSTSANVWLRLWAAKRGWGGRGHLSLRPGGHRATRPGPPYGREPGHAHQSGRDVPSKKRGETSLEGRCERSTLEILLLFFHFQGVTHQQWYLFNDFLIEPIDKVKPLVGLISVKYVCGGVTLMLR